LKSHEKILRQEIKNARKKIKSGIALLVGAQNQQKKKNNGSCIACGEEWKGRIFFYCNGATRETILVKKKRCFVVFCT